MRTPTRPNRWRLGIILGLVLLLGVAGRGLVASGAVLAPPAGLAPAATITVTTTGDTLDAAAGNCAAITISSLPGPDGVISLREAICAANNTAGADSITFAVNGTFL